ncbi:cell wall-binding repeat-containing protein [Intrasporangium sp. DVR]|uniref:cell wall-binding repeat-containing protein n=1 Tax=Intrasporangium sp. DVR TaxID=3127867 RepID=UPI00313A5DBF
MKRTYALAAAATALALSVAATPAHAETDDPLDQLTPSRASSDLPARTAGTSGTVDVLRISGSTRITTAVKASVNRFGDAGSETAAGAVVLSRSDAYADALGGSALAGAAGAPLLLTPGDALHPAVETEIIRLLGTGAPGGPVYVLGGVAAVSTGVTDRLVELGYTVVRLEGIDRYATSVEIARQTAALVPAGQPQIVFATTGLNFPDGLAAGATAGGYWSSVVLTKDASIPAPVAAYLDEMNALTVPLVAVGGAAARARYGWTAEIVGADRYETAAMVADFFWADPDTTNDDPTVIGLATGLNWPDALAGGANVAGGGPLVLTRTDSLPGSTSFAITSIVTSGSPSPVQWGAVFGGTEAVSYGVKLKFKALLNQ